ncbi:hypothetical protein ZTR_05893 [Talaromyces verruculosus]|nr:hypothetical protein ZTR_05893 [Talaromyces verruculosus]
MESAESSPEKQNTQKTHAELLKAFQSFKPAGRAPSKTPQPPSTSRTQRSSTPVTNAGQAIRAGMTAFELGSPSTTPSTQETTTRKRARRIPYTEQAEENESSGSDTPLSKTVKRPRQTPAKTSDKQASTIPKHVVEVQIHNDLKFAESLSQKNGSFLRSMPSTAVSYLEAKLARVTDEMTRLHKEKVDAIRLEYVAELQRDMDERQKVINMLLQKPDV